MYYNKFEVVLTNSGLNIINLEKLIMMQYSDIYKKSFNNVIIFDIVKMLINIPTSNVKINEQDPNDIVILIDTNLTYDKYVINKGNIMSEFSNIVRLSSSIRSVEYGSFNDNVKQYFRADRLSKSIIILFNNILGFELTDIGIHVNKLIEKYKKIYEKLIYNYNNRRYISLGEESFIYRFLVKDYFKVKKEDFHLRHATNHILGYNTAEKFLNNLKDEDILTNEQFNMCMQHILFDKLSK